MKTKKVFFLLNEKRERITVRRKTKRVVSNSICRQCGTRTFWLTLEEVSAITGKDNEMTVSEMETGKLDFRKAENGQIFICQNSVFARF